MSELISEAIEMHLKEQLDHLFCSQCHQKLVAKADIDGDLTMQIQVLPHECEPKESKNPVYVVVTEFDGVESQPLAHETPLNFASLLETRERQKNMPLRFGRNCIAKLNFIEDWGNE